MPYADPARQREYQLEWMHSRRAEFFAGKSCVKCGSKEFLELDHVDPSQKVSHRIWSWSAGRMAAELAKCQVLCTECHKAKTAAEKAAKIRCGTESAYRRGCRCEPCRLEAAFHRQRRRGKIAA